MFINTVVDFQDLKSTCDQSYMRNRDFEHFVSAHFGHSALLLSLIKLYQASTKLHQKVFAQQ